MTDDEGDDRYGSVNIAENDSSRSAGVKLSAVITLQTEHFRHGTEKVGHGIIVCRGLLLLNVLLLSQYIGFLRIPTALHVPKNSVFYV